MNSIEVCEAIHHFFVISTINSTGTVKNQLKYGLKTRLEHQMGCKLRTFPGTRLVSYICYMHKGGK
jgi:hypothetical protein